MSVPETEHDARVHDLVLAHLRSAGVSDADEQAAAFVERLRVGRAEQPPANDARLWGRTVAGLSTSLPSQQTTIVARQLIAILRRVREPHRRTWAPGDPLPSPPLAKMADLDWDEWLHQDKAGTGCYRMSAKDRRRNAASIHDYEGVQLWPFLLEGTQVAAGHGTAGYPVRRYCRRPRRWWGRCASFSGIRLSRHPS